MSDDRTLSDEELAELGGAAIEHAFELFRDPRYGTALASSEYRDIAKVALAPVISALRARRDEVLVAVVGMNAAVDKAYTARREFEQLAAWKDSLKFCAHCAGMVEPEEAARHVAQCARKVDDLRASQNEVGRLTQAVAVANAQAESAKAQVDAAEAKPERAV